MNLNSDLSSIRSTKSAWFNLKYILLFLNMILVYINSGLFFYLFTKDFKKVQFNLKHYPNLRYTTQISPDRLNQSLEDNEITKQLNLNNLPQFSTNQDNEIKNHNRLLSINQKYKSLDQVVSMFNQQQENVFNFENDRRQTERELKELKRIGLMHVIRNRKDESSNDLNNLKSLNNLKNLNNLNELSGQNSGTELVNSIQNQPINLDNQLINDKKNKTLISKKSNYNDLYNLNKQLSLIYLFLGLNNFLEFICLTKDSNGNVLLVLTLPPIFTILTLIVTKFNYEINLYLCVVYLIICFLTLIHVKRLKKESTSEQIIVHSPSRFYSNFASLESTSNPTNTSQFLMIHDLDSSCKSSLSSNKEKSNYNLVNVERSNQMEKKSSNEQIPAIKRIRNFQKITPPPSYNSTQFDCS